MLQRQFVADARMVGTHHAHKALVKQHRLVEARLQLRQEPNGQIGIAALQHADNIGRQREDFNVNMRC